MDATNKFVYVPTLGTDQMFQFTFDATTGRLASNTPAVAQLKAGVGPRHFAISPRQQVRLRAQRAAATVTTLSLDPRTGAADRGRLGGGPAARVQARRRRPRGAPGAPPRNVDNDVWAADLHLTPDEKFLYISERTTSSLSAFRVDAASGKLAYAGNTPTEKQPRGFAIDPKGKFLIASGEKSTTISVYAIDAATGGLRMLSSIRSARAPTGSRSSASTDGIERAPR